MIHLLPCLIASIALSFAAQGREPIAVLHETDLFRPHGDPDDHWDLACEYALAKVGAIDRRAFGLSSAEQAWGS